MVKANATVIKKGKASNKKTQKAKVLGKTPIVIGVVHAKWCGHCQQLMDENAGAWPQLIEEMKPRNDMEIYTIEDSDQNKDEQLTKLNALINNGEKIQVNGFPTIFKIKDGQITPHVGGRSIEELKSFAAGTGIIGGTKRIMKKKAKRSLFGFKLW